MVPPKFDEAEIFNVARRIDSPDARRLYLQQVCETDAALLARVEVLLRAHDEGRTFLDVPAAGVRDLDVPLAEGPGTQIGPYKLLEQIGEGGFGVVFMAEQQQPIRRTVAVKILKPGMDTRQVVARFEAERQALAMMDHPNIGRVLDGGETASGRPYFVMDLVKGVPITRYCDEHQLTPRERLGLFADVCAAVQHAHQKGIIHRDLKPSNVLVAAYDGRPVPKLIDFGVAKALGERLTERTLVTGFGGIVGTLEYMSPEQAEFNALDVDTRADIYGLGVLLYELLTGTTPLTHARLKKAALAEVLRLIREEDPPKPSMRLSDSKDSLASISAQRKLEPRQLTKEIRGDLDWIVMKALEKDRNRRYDSPGSFADDVGRYLRGDAVLACPPSTAYRLKKFAQRHRGAVLVTATVALALLAGATAAIWQAIEATHAKHDALAFAAAAKDAKNKAEAKEAETQAVLDFVQKRVFAAARPEGKAGGLGHDVTLRRALKSALDAVEKSFENQPLVEARVRRTLGETFLLLGEADTAANQFLLAQAIHTQILGADDPETLRTRNNLGSARRAQGQYAEALTLYQEVLASRIARLGPDDPETIDTMQNVATAHADLGHYTESLNLREKVLKIREATLGPLHRDTLQAMNNLANAYSENHRHEDALTLDEKTVALLEKKYGRGHIETLDSRNNLALSYAAVRRFDQALELQQETLELMRLKYGPTHPTTLLCMHNVAKAHADLNQYDEAVSVLNKTLALQKAELRPGHPHTIQTIYSLANDYGKLKKYKEALDLHREALKLRKTELGPNNRNTLFSMWGVAANLIELGRGDEAVPIIDECLQRAAGDAADPAFSGLADKRLRHFEKRKDGAGCRNTAELWEKLRCPDAGSLYNAARYRAVAAAVLRAADKSPEGAKQADAEADRAMAWVKQAVAAGYKDIAQLKKDADLGTLRNREDFRELEAKLEAGAEKNKK